MRHGGLGPSQANSVVPLLALVVVLTALCVLSYAPHPAAAVDAMNRVVPRGVIGLLLVAIALARLPTVGPKARSAIAAVAAALLKLFSRDDGSSPSTD